MDRQPTDEAATRRPSPVDDSRTYNPPARLRLARAGVEMLRVVPVILYAAIGLGVVVTLEWLADDREWAAGCPRCPASC